MAAMAHAHLRFPNAQRIMDPVFFRGTGRLLHDPRLRGLAAAESSKVLASVPPSEAESFVAQSVRRASQNPVVARLSRDVAEEIRNAEPHIVRTIREALFQNPMVSMLQSHARESCLTQKSASIIFLRLSLAVNELLFFSPAQSSTAAASE